MNKKQIKRLKIIASALPPTLKLGELVVTGEVLLKDYPQIKAPEGQTIYPDKRYKIKVPVKVDHVKEMAKLCVGKSQKDSDLAIQQYCDYVVSLVPIPNPKTEENEPVTEPV